MNARFVLTPEAEADIVNIWQYIAQDNPAAADCVVAELFDAFDRLADMPGIGHFRDDLLDRRHKFWTVYSYLVVYRWEITPLQILAVVHGARDLGAFLSQRVAP